MWLVGAYSIGIVTGAKVSQISFFNIECRSKGFAYCMGQDQ